jgi:hypothetical protein
MREHNQGPAPPGSIVLARGAPTPPPRRNAPPAQREPSWGRVLATTISLWTSRRLKRMGIGTARTTPRPGQNPAPPAIEAGRRTGRRWRLAALVLAMAVVALTALVVSGAVSTSSQPPGTSGRTASGGGAAAGNGSSPLAAAAAARGRAAAWIDGQVAASAIVACDPVMCTALEAHGAAAGRLLVLRLTAADPLGAGVIVATPAIRSQFGGLLAGEYAPAVIASFGSGATRVDVRAIAPDGAAAYASALRSDLADRKRAGAQLLRNPNLHVTAPGAGQLRSGDVDSRLLVTLAALASQHAFTVTTFSDAAPGARAPFREVTLTSAGHQGGASLPAALRLVRAQHAPYLPAQAAIVRLAGGQAAVRIAFAAPSPLGLLSGGS